MKRIWAFFSDQLMRLHTHQNIRRFNADNKVVITHRLDQMNFIQRTLHDPFCSNTTIFLKQMFLKRTTVYADTDWNIVLFRFVYYCLYPFFCTDISRIDTDLISSILNCCDCHLIIKMNVCNKRNMNLFSNLFDCFCSLHCRNCTADDLTSCFFQTQDLLHCGFYIFCPCICHRLDCYRMVSPNHNIPNSYFFRLISVHDLYPLFPLLCKFFLCHLLRQNHRLLSTFFKCLLTSIF